MNIRYLSQVPRNARGARLLASVLASLFALLASNPAAAVPLGKSLCDPPPASTLGATCTAQGAGINTTVYYKIILDNTGGAATNANLNDPYPTGFNPVTVTCTAIDGANAGTNVGAVLANPPSATPLSASVPMLANQKVECVVAGYFDSTGQSWNNQAQSGTNQSNQLNTTIQQTLLQTDISTLKNCTPTSVNVTGGPQTVHCTIVITNNGPKDAFLGSILKLKDELALTSNGVPLSITLVGAPTCQQSPPSANGIPVDCLNGPVTAGSAPLTSSYATYFTWGYAAGTPGYLPVGGTMTIDYTLSIERSTNITCVKDLNPAGVWNRAKIEFNLPSGTPVVDTNPANNESGVTNITVDTGIQTVDPLCGSALSWAPLKIKKKLLSTQPLGGFLWGNLISYQITITNITNQTLTGIDVSDWSMSLPGTPPYIANTVSWFPPGSGVNLSPTIIPGYFSIGQIWKGQITSLGPNASYTFLPFVAKYSSTSCDNYFNGTNPIKNVFRAQWTGTATPPGGGGPVTQTWYAEDGADALMAERPECKLSAIKTTVTSPNKIVFGNWFTYTVKFKNQDPTNPVSIGTLADRLRIVQPNYATSMQVDYNFSCPLVSGIQNQPLLSPTLTNTITYTQQPHQGLDLLTPQTPGQPVVFPPNKTLTCTINIRLQRPPKGDPYCIGTGRPQVENITLMDVSQTYGPTVAWPPTGTYNPALVTAQPTSMGSRNWASVRTDLPHCFNLQVNKSVKPLTTWITNPTPTEYTIVLHNFGDAIPLAPFNPPGNQWPNWVGPQLQDFFTQNPPNTAVTSFVTPANCFSGLAPQCRRLGPPPPPALPLPPLPGLGPFPSPFHIGVEGLGNTLTDREIVLKFKVQPVCQYPKAKNELILFWSGPNAQADWYSNDDRSCFGPPPLVPPYSLIPPNSVIGSCSRVEQPCLRVGDLQVVKTVVDMLGVPTPANFGMTVNCTPYGFPAPNTPITVPSNGSATVANIPETSNCAVTEPPLLPIASVAACGGSSASWSTVISPPQPVTIVANQTVTVTVTNTVVCDFIISKSYDHPPVINYPDGAVFNFTVNCTNPANPNATPVTLTGTITSTHINGGNIMSVPNTAPVGWVCTATETVPTGANANGCYWAPGVAVSPNPVTIQAAPAINAVGFKNNYICPASNPNYDLSISKVGLGLVNGGPDKRFVITVQNVGNNSLSAADLSHLTITENLPAGSVITSYGNTDLAVWSCTPMPSSLPATPPPGIVCHYIGSNSVAPFAALPQLQIVATPGTGTTQYFSPANGGITITTQSPLNCPVMSLTGTGTGHDDVILGNNQVCISM
jgi:hypothetical protein